MEFKDMWHLPHKKKERITACGEPITLKTRMAVNIAHVTSDQPLCTSCEVVMRSDGWKAPQ